MNKMQVRLQNQEYEICIGPQLLQRTGELVAPYASSKRVIVVTDAHLAPLYLKTLLQSLESAKLQADSIILNPGESIKSYTGLQELLDRLLDLNPDRRTLLIALGGGVVGDLVGFAASILLRGLNFVQIPTTLLAQVDSSVGGKTGINTRHGKNLVGSFHQPRLVLTDINTLSSLPPRELRAGYAEIVKYGLLGNAEFFAWLEQEGKSVLTLETSALIHAVKTSCRMKADIVSRDEKEKQDARALLNLGHTLGHALEAEAGFGDALLHGEAVAIGIVLAYALAVKLGYAGSSDYERVKHHLASAELPTSPAHIPHPWNVEALLARCYQDKKVQDGKLTFILPRGIGQALVARDVDPVAARSVLAESIQ